jgi:hypothetical protein
MNAKASNAAYRELTRQIKRLEKQRAKLPPVASAWRRSAISYAALSRDNPRSDSELWALISKDGDQYFWEAATETGREKTLKLAKKAADATLKRAGVLL